MVACTSADKSSKAGSRTTIDHWKCADTGLVLITESDPSAKGKTWNPPASQPNAADHSLPGLYLNFVEPGSENVQGNVEFVEPDVPWVGDLNGDGLKDFILRDGIGDSKQTAVFVGCGAHLYQPVFMGSADEVSVEKDSNEKAGWKLLRFRYVLAGSYEYEVIVRRWDGKEYKSCNQYRIPVDSPKMRTNGCSE
jgi:hypothetical protein